MAVKVIPARINPNTRLPNNGLQKRRVAAYARVSTLQEEQANSYEAQVDYYTRYIKSRPDWEFAGIYTDKGVSGTNTKKRIGFNRMVDDALEGKIDLIVTKAVTRFARNTVDTLETTRKLKENGVEVFFEEQNVYTFDSSGELMLTILASMGQEESRNISENVKWGKKKKYADGQVTLAYKNFLGYDKHPTDPHKGLIVNEEQAEIVRLIYKLYLKGKTTSYICNYLEERGYESPTRKEMWYQSTIQSILQNEKYKGDALVQKTYVPDFKSHKSVRNQGEIQQYYQEKHHDPIINPDEWDMVQIEIDRRKELGYTYNCTNVFSCKLVCADCGSFFGQKVWHSNDKYRKVVYQCNDKFNKEHERCKTPALTENEIKRMFVDAYSEFLSDRTKVVSDCQEMISILDNTNELEKNINEANEKAEEIVVLVKNLVETNSRIAMSQEEYQAKYDAYDKQHNSLLSKINELQLEIARKKSQAKFLQEFINDLERRPSIIEEWDEDIWTYLIDKAIVNDDSSITFLFRNGKEITTK